MNTMTLLRAMSAIDPQDMEAALHAHTADSKPERAIRFTGRDSSEAVSGNNPVLPKQSDKAGRRITAGGWAAAAACVALIAAAGLYFRQTEDDLMLPTSDADYAVSISETGSVPPLHEQTTGTSLTGTDLTEAVTSAAGTADTDQQTTGTPDDASAAGTPDSDMQETSAPEAEPLPTAETTAALPADPPRTPVPVLIAMADSSGTLYHADGSPFDSEESTFSILTDAAKIEDYLNRTEPPVTLGSGRKSADTAEAIRSKPQMLLVRWQMPDNRWTSYGFQQAVCEPDGTLQLSLAMYAEEADVPENPWIYETALLAEAGMLDGITNVKINFTFYTDTEETGIRNYMIYDQSLAEDVWISVLPE